MPKKKLVVKKHTVQIHFDNEKVAERFLSWLCESGEQEYFTYQEYRERKEAGNITAVAFDYDFDKFEVTTTCGRLDDES